MDQAVADHSHTLASADGLQVSHQFSPIAKQRGFSLGTSLHQHLFADVVTNAYSVREHALNELNQSAVCATEIHKDVGVHFVQEESLVNEALAHFGIVVADVVDVGIKHSELPSLDGRTVSDVPVFR